MRSFAIEYKAALANILDEQKTKRAENRAIREQKAKKSEPSSPKTPDN